jgi:trehalose synthase
LGIPTVATDIGTIHRIICNGENGFLVSSREEWKKVIISLIKDQYLREKMGKKASQTVEDLYSVNANKGKYLNILDGIAGS